MVAQWSDEDVRAFKSDVLGNGEKEKEKEEEGQWCLAKK